ncbi:hypothetical protein [uncultured Phenylobacterium sp.]|uniref:hypothetical protein n=1 Tax=uncultured Phenylobacterium sp. TaxID=349273 RepID=UPI0025F2C29B|nr:hypothetical protein [uncultured Phenylobacterium sp.]
MRRWDVAISFFDDVLRGLQATPVRGHAESNAVFHRHRALRHDWRGLNKSRQCNNAYQVSSGQHFESPMMLVKVDPLGGRSAWRDRPLPGWKT